MPQRTRCRYFGKTVTVNRLNLYPRNDAGNVGKGFPVDFRVEASNEVQSFSFANTECRYLRVYATKLHAVDGREYRMQFAEVEAYYNTTAFHTLRPKV